MDNDYLQYRIKRARQTFQDAKSLFDSGSYNSSINRLYYAAFYATIALLISRKIEVKSHNGVKQKLGSEFVAKGIISKDEAKLFGLLSDLRNKGDYDDLFDFEMNEVGSLFTPVKSYIDRIDELITS